MIFKIFDEKSDYQEIIVTIFVIFPQNWQFRLENESFSTLKLNFEYLKFKNWNVSIQFESEDEHLDGGTLKT